MWAEVKDGAYKKLQGNMKRRSGNIGIAPQMIGRQQPAVTPAARPSAGAAPAARPAKPVAPIGKNMSDDKRARLEAIRAANAGKSGGAAPAAAAVAEPAAVEELTGPTPAEAPTRAPLGAAAPSGGTGIPFNDDNLLGGVPANTAMAEDKVDRLKAIRSGNLAKRG
jgi:hypothetical protein